MMLFLRKYGFLFIPPVYWLIYLGARLTYNGLAGEFSPDFFQGIRHEGVYIICSLCVFYFFSAWRWKLVMGSSQRTFCS